MCVRAVAVGTGRGIGSRTIIINRSALNLLLAGIIKDYVVRHLKEEPSCITVNESRSFGVEELVDDDTLGKFSLLPITIGVFDNNITIGGEGVVEQRKRAESLGEYVLSTSRTRPKCV